jgi:hypothetical protein
MSHRHLIRQLLHANLLVLQEARASSLHVQFADGVVVLASLRGTLVERHELRARYLHRSDVSVIKL